MPQIRWEPSQVLKENSYPKQVAYSPDGNTLAIWYSVIENHAQTGHVIEFWNCRTWRREGGFKDQETNGDVQLAWAPDSTQVVVISGWPNTAIKIWDVRKKTVVRQLGGHLFRANAVAWSRDGALIAKSAEGLIELWDAANGLLVRTLESAAVSSSYRSDCHTLAWSADSKRIGAACADVVYGKPNQHDEFKPNQHEEFRIWDASSGRLSKSLVAPIWAAAWSPDLMTVATGNVSESSTLVYDVQSRRLRRKLPTKSLPITRAWSADSRYLAVLGHQRTVSIWNTGDGRLVTEVPGLSLSWSPADHNLASAGDDGSVHIWKRIDGPK